MSWRHSGQCYSTLAKRVPSFTNVDVETFAEETANVPEHVSNTLYCVTVKVDASTTMDFKTKRHIIYMQTVLMARRSLRRSFKYGHV